MYHSMPPHVAYMKPKPNAPTFFVSEELKMDIYNKQAASMAQVDPGENPGKLLFLVWFPVCMYGCITPKFTKQYGPSLIELLQHKK